MVKIAGGRSLILDELALESLAAELYGVMENEGEDLLAHAKAVAEWSRKIALAHGLDVGLANATWVAALFHDLGKIRAQFKGVLEAPGRLTDAEWEIMHEHPRRSWGLFAALMRNGLLIGVDPDVQVGILHHHEHMDGSGYPDGLRGDQIPLSARIIGVADAFSALTAPRVYHKACSPVVAVKTIEQERGHFDPEIVALLRDLVVKKSSIRGSRIRSVSASDNA